jgi:sigma-B regulation protein RsbU (phosphoserine phosphatase)
MHWDLLRRGRLAGAMWRDSAMTASAVEIATGLRIPCGSVWGGIEPVSLDLSTAGVAASLYSASSGGRRGGDIYYLSVCSSGLLTRVAIADVRGHGEQASEISGWLYQALYDRMNTLDGAAVLSDLNEMVHHRGFDAITTAVVMSYHTRTSTLFYSYAGHPPALIRRGRGHWEPLLLVTDDARANLPLGVFGGERYEQRTMRMRSGDRFFIYTDGVSEARGRDEDDLFGAERLVGALEQAGDRDVAGVRDSVLTRLAEHCLSSPNSDDCTMIVVQVA